MGSSVIMLHFFYWGVAHSWVLHATEPLLSSSHGSILIRLALHSNAITFGISYWQTVNFGNHSFLLLNDRLLLSQMSNIHRGGCSSLDVSRDGKHLATAGDRVIKIWDYHMRLDINFQVLE